MIPAQPIRVTCPECNQPFTAQIHSIIDVGEQPELKEQLLRGRLNIVQCPHCGAAGAIGTPILYHDPDKELAFVLMPTELNLPRDEQEKLIGGLTNALIDALPAEKRRGYLFTPKTFLSLENMIKTILEADGVTPEMMESQEKRIRLIQDLLVRLDDEERFKAFVEEHASEIDYELFLILRAMIDTAIEDGRSPEAEPLAELRHRLLDVTGGPADSEVKVETLDDLLEVLQGVESEAELQALVATNRAVFDYGFFQQLTDRIENARQAGDADRADQLLQLRRNLVEATETVDQATEAALQDAAQRLQDILSADDPDAAVREQLDEIDEAFLVVLSANIAQAEDQGQDDIGQTLRDLYEFVLDQLEEQMPPETRVINQLLRAETADERATILENAGDSVGEDLARILEAVGDDARAQGQAELASQFDEVIRQVRDYVKDQHDH